MNGGLLGADSIIFDLEDAVAPDQKDAARILVKSALRSLDFGGCEIIIRMNALDTPYWEEDIEEMVPLGPSAIMPTKSVTGITSGSWNRKLLKQKRRTEWMWEKSS